MAEQPPTTNNGKPAGWTFLTNHAHVLIAISRNGDLRQRDIAHAVGITVGAVQKIIGELEAGGYLAHERVGRRKRRRTAGGMQTRGCSRRRTANERMGPANGPLLALAARGRCMGRP